MTDAVFIPCCGNSYCDGCIRNALQETEEHICPTCGKSEISPDSLIPNHFLRTLISSFYNETGTIVKTTRVIALPVIHAQHNGPVPHQPGVAPQEQTGPPVTPYMPPPRPTGAPVGANALPRLQMPPPSRQGPAPLQQLTTNTEIPDKVAPLVPQTTVTDEELAKGMTIKTTVGYRRPMRLDSQDLPKPRGPPLNFMPLPPMPPTRPPGPTPPPRFPPANMPPTGAMLSIPHRIIPPQAFPGPQPAVMLGQHLHVHLPPPPGPMPIFPSTSVVYAEKPLTRDEFYRTKQMLKETKEKKRDLIDDFAKELGYKRDQTKRKSLSRSRSRSRSRSWSRPRPRFRSRSSARNRFQSGTPFRRSVTPRRSRSRTLSSRSQLYRSPLSRSPHQRWASRSRTRSRSFSPRRSRLHFLSNGCSPVRSKRKTPSRRRSLTPARQRSWSRSLSRSRSRTPAKRSRRSMSSKSPSRKRSKSPTQNRPPLPPSKRFLAPRPRRRSRSPPYHDNFRNDWPPYCHLKSQPQQGYPQRHYTQAQLSYGNMQPGDPCYRTVIESAGKVLSQNPMQPTWSSDFEEGNTDKETASSIGSDVSQSQRPSSDNSPSKKQKLDEETRIKIKKHKHRHSRHKKHKKQKHKKKQQKLEKEEKS